MSAPVGIKQYVLMTKKQIDTVKKNDSKAKRLARELEEQSADIRSLYAQLQQVGELASVSETEETNEVNGQEGNEVKEQTEQSENNRQRYVELFNLLNENMEQIVKLNKATQQEYSDYMGRKFTDFKKKYPGLFDRLLEGDLDSETLTHVLDTLTLVEQGRLDMKQGRDRGLDYLTHKFELPPDFFNKNKVFLDGEDE